MSDVYTHAAYDRSGRILQMLRGPARFIECDSNVDDVTHYVDVDNVALVERRALDFEQTIDGLIVTLTGLPGGLTVDTNGQMAITDSEPLVISYDIPGTYSVQIYGLVEYLDSNLEVTVGDS